MASKIESGTVMVNDVLSAYGCPEAPFGGVKQSGLGRVHGPEGLLAMTELCVVHGERLPLRFNPVHFPYHAKKERIASQMLRFLFRPGKRPPGLP